jgi:CheY-like chemotaxis protein
MTDIRYPDTKVVIADDETGLLRAWQRSITAFGLFDIGNVRIFTNAEEALAQMQEAPDLVISDFDYRTREMKEAGQTTMNGREFLAALRGRFGDRFKAILTSGNDPDEITPLARSVDAEFLPKPWLWTKETEPLIERLLSPAAAPGAALENNQGPA